MVVSVWLNLSTMPSVCRWKGRGNDEDVFARGVITAHQQPVPQHDRRHTPRIDPLPRFGQIKVQNPITCNRAGGLFLRPHLRRGHQRQDQINHGPPAPTRARKASRISARWQPSATGLAASS
ncbi:unnamed protein product [Lampetra fluviatilis]